MSELVTVPHLLYTFPHNLTAAAAGRRRNHDRAGVKSADEIAMNSTGIEPANISTEETPAAGDFPHEAAARIDAVRSTLSAIFESDGKQILKSRDAQKYFGVDANLSWQIFKLLSAGDLLALAQYIPAGVSMQRIFLAARERAIDDSLIVAAEAAFTSFEQFVALHASDRVRFESMTAGMAQGEEARLVDIQHRKALFRAHTHFWGVEVGTVYTANIIGPSRTDPTLCDSLYLLNLMNFSRLRPNADTYVLGVAFKKNSREKVLTPAPEPLLADAGDGGDAARGATYGKAVLPQFSSKALPLLRTELDEWNREKIYLAGHNVGLTSSVDLAFGHIMRGIPGAFAKDKFIITVRNVSTRPAHQLYTDILVDRRIFPDLIPSFKMYGHASMAASPEDLEQPAWELPCRQQIVRMKPTDDARLAEIPRRKELLSFACERQGWSLNDFDLYRLHVEYPMLDTVIVISLLRPAFPGGAD